MAATLPQSAGTPLVSVVVPCYNSERWLRETLESVFAQSHPAIETILVNDGSTDRTRALIDSYGDRVRAIHGPNRGAASARNTGTASARGQFIQYLDADDLLLPDAIATRVRALAESGGDVAYGDWQYLRETRTSVFERAESVTREMRDVHANPRVATFTDFWSPPAALLYRRAMIDRIGPWKQHLAPIEDARYLQDAAFTGAVFTHVPGVSALYRVFQGPSHSRRSPVAFVGAVFRNACEIEVLWQRAGELDDERRKILAGTYDYAARGLFRGDRALFGQALAALYRLQPGWDWSWSKIAARLDRAVGHRAALALLRALNRPAP